MSKQLVFIDDSGDPGFKKVSSSNFVMAAALFINPEVAMSLSERISDYRKSLGWRDDYEFKFAKIRKDIIIELLRIVSDYDFQIYAAYVDKASFRQTAPIIDKEKLYDWTIKELLSMMPIEEAKIEIDGRSGKQNMRRTATYLRREVNHDGSKKLEIKFEDSVDDNLIQLADLIAGSINRSMTNKTDSKVYIDIIKSKISEIRRIDQR
ncbi:DUF3800 domain-containing protein [Candidatus Saccharibacteria bacterium]|nr:DUF3800 domain-containing protein [Candidatus Saccharibacteria bacterium]